MTHRLVRLTASGYVRREPDPTDGRGALVTLTPSGKRLIDRVVTTHYDNERELLAPLSAEATLLAGTLRKLLIELEDHVPPEETATDAPTTVNANVWPVMYLADGEARNSTALRDVAPACRPDPAASSRERSRDCPRRRAMRYSDRF